MKASDEIDITGDLVASSFCNAKLTINKDVVTITPNVRSYLFEWGLHIFCWTVCIFMSAKVWQLEPNLDSKTDFVIVVFTLGGLFSLGTTLICRRSRRRFYFDLNEKVLNVGSSNNPKIKVAFDSFEKLLLVTTRIYSTESPRTYFELSVLTNTQKRVTLMCHSDYYAIQYDSDVLAEILKLEVESLEA
ncbi:MULTISPECIES: hypothetical protein [Pseudoalteromonas]|jgi:hypothetical protein|uniref:hypothetical protein n=1 Tax=Pseudoalteromonas TaxID=53246 RepID=UPI0002CC8C0C|nr:MULTISPECIES: hypothetical protein [Pseudoalteromonas]MCP4060386.1 hypothetical protein [Pseudoalteromonas sp.]ENN97677.1 hypothetical protein J139_16285 [Pseudoalteromonas agarivorans S816]MDI3247245.1 hypothetical protein [Pseudoalteromonas agarivorans]TMS65351.1 hypothetical protein CWB83_13595 [Pseudoalteromonas sp. S1691]TMS67359.1 hypothetical protein CWB86_15330 [Pseudoalteromonas sp. S1731]|tara:strand:- start:719 stop:1285 length:567 start_codon:yes stop_codon:yes gene_type:complete